MAVGAHPDDIEFMMAGTLAVLREAGFEIHMMNLANGNLGGQTCSSRDLARIRLGEARAAAKRLGAVHHPPLFDDLGIYYEPDAIRRLASVIRSVGPSILLVPSPQDYMEDHVNTCRLAVTAAFVRGMRNYRTSPPRRPWNGDVTIYHAMPHGLRDPLRRRIVPGLFVDTTSVIDLKREALAEHRSQQDWLAETQKMNAYIATMDVFSFALGRMSRRFLHAEGWRRHMHYGFCADDVDPLRAALGRRCKINPAYERSLERGNP